MTKKHIVLVGMPGSGKSTLGFHLSKLMGIPFVDTDNYIVTKAQKSVAAIFKEDGEEVFRNLERDTLKEILKNEPSVISTGGGMPCFFNNITLIVDNAITVYIKVSAHNLFEYLKNDKKRPLVKNRTPEELMSYIISSMENRKCFYEKADITIDAYSEEPTQLAIKLVNLITEFRNNQKIYV